MRRVGLVVGVLVLLALTLAPAFAQPQPFADVPQDHWAYDAIAQLAQAGVIEGYPDGMFKGKRNMTRYEFAVAIARIMDRLEQGAVGPQGPKGDVGPPGPAGPMGPAGGGDSLTPEQQAALEKLTTEFAPELKSLRDDLESLTNRVSALESKTESGPVVKVGGSMNWRVGLYGSKLTLSEDTLSTGYPALETPAVGNIAVTNPEGGVYGYIPIADALKDSYKANRFMSVRSRLDVSAQLSETSSAMVSLLAGPSTSLIDYPRYGVADDVYYVAPNAWNGNGLMDTVQVDQAWVKYHTDFLTATDLTVGKQYLKRGVGLLFDNDQEAIPALRADFGSSGVRLGAFLGMLDPAAFFGRTSPVPMALDQYGNSLGMYSGLGAEQILGAMDMYHNGQDMYNLFYADFEVSPGWRIGGNWLQSGFNQESGWSASLNGSIFGVGLYGEYAQLTDWPTGVDFVDWNYDGVQQEGEGNLSESDTAWMAGLKWQSPSVCITGEYGEIDAGYAFAPTFGGWDEVGGPGYYNLPLSALHPRAAIDPHDINWIDRPLFLDPTNIARGWHATLTFPTLLGEGNSLCVSYADGDAYAEDYLGWLFDGAVGTAPEKWRDADSVWYVKYTRQVSDAVKASLLYGRRQTENVMSPQTIPVDSVDETYIYALNDDLQVIRGEVSVEF